MARPRVYTDQQRADIVKRVIDGKESVRAIAKEFGISEASIRKWAKPEAEEIKRVAESIVETERSLAKLGVSAQIIAVDLASRLRSISSNLAAAADNQAAMAHRLSAIAAQHLERVSDVDPLEEKSQAALKTVSGMVAMANEASKIPLNLIAANKEQAQRVTEPEREKALSLDEFYGQIENG